MKIKLLLLIFCLSFTFSKSLYVSPDEVAVERGGNYSFDAIATLDFAKYTIKCDGETVIYQHKRNSSTIHVDYVLPAIMELRIYKFVINTYDVHNYPVANVTYRFVIRNLTDEELFTLFHEKEDAEENVDDLTGKLNETNNNLSAWMNYDYESTFEKNMNVIIAIISTITLCVSILGVSLVKVRHSAKEQTKHEAKKRKEADKNYAKSQLTKQAVSHCMDIPISANIDGKSIQINLLNEWEREAVKKYNKYYDASFFLRPDKSIAEQKKKKLKELSSLEVLMHRLTSVVKENTEPDYTEWWYVVSAICKYLEEKGYINENKYLFPVRCSLNDIRTYLGEIYDKKEAQDMRSLITNESDEDQTEKNFNKATETAKKRKKKGKNGKNGKKIKKKTHNGQIDVDKEVARIMAKK